jgi:hypothetical protein
MALHTPTNEYQGVNAHLYCFFQARGGWASLHSLYISDLARAINPLLPPGNIVDVEQSLQIRGSRPRRDSCPTRCPVSA